jgi:low temperature requirement protein LtrA
MGGHLRSWLASCWPPWASRACWPTPGDREPLGAFCALPLVGGVALYLAAQLLFKRRMHNALSLPRLVTICVLLAALPAAVLAPPLVGLVGLVLVLAALIVVETTRYAQTRRRLRGT